MKNNYTALQVIVEFTCNKNSRSSQVTRYLNTCHTLMALVITIWLVPPCVTLFNTHLQSYLLTKQINKTSLYDKYEYVEFWKV